MKRITAALTAAVMAVSLAICSNSADPVGESSQPSQTDIEPQAVHLNLTGNWNFQYFYTIITPKVSSSSGYGITCYPTSFYDTLFEYSTDGEVVGVLAEDRSMSEDGKTYTFQTKQGVRFSDGSDLTAEDVAKSILAAPVNLGQYDGSYGRLSTIIEDAVVADEYTAEFHLTQPCYNTLRELCLTNPSGIVSSEQFNEDLTAKDTFRAATYGTGPYVCAGDNDGQIWNLVRNPNYWGEAPDVDSLSIKYIPDNDAEILAMQNGEVDFLSGIKNVSAESFEQMGQTESSQAQADEKSLQTYYVGYNLSDPIFDDQVVRRATSSAVDKDAIVESIYGDLYDKADTFFPRSLPYCDVEQTIYNFDPDHANQILDEAGYTDTDGDSICEKDGMKLPASSMYQTGSASDDNLVVYICGRANKIGIELTPQSAQMMDWYTMVQSGEYGLMIFKTQGGYYDPASVMTNINPTTSMDPILMQIGVSQPETIALMNELDSSVDETRIQEIYSAILATTADQCLTIPLIYTRQLTVYSDTVSSYTSPTDASFVSVQNIHLKQFIIIRQKEQTAKNLLLLVWPDWNMNIPGRSQTLTNETVKLKA